MLIIVALMLQERSASFLAVGGLLLKGSYGDKRVFVRYYRDRPLTISSESDVLAIVNRYKRLCARTFYATIHVYKSLESSSLLDDPGNIIYSTPFFDIDGALEDYKGVLEVASLIVEFSRELRVEGERVYSVEW